MDIKCCNVSTSVVDIQSFQRFLPPYFYPRPKYHPTAITYYYHKIPPPPHSSIKRSKYIKVEKEYKTLSHQYLVKLFDLKGEVQDS